MKHSLLAKKVARQCCSSVICSSLWTVLNVATWNICCRLLFCICWPMHLVQCSMCGTFISHYWGYYRLYSCSFNTIVLSSVTVTVIKVQYLQSSLLWDRLCYNGRGPLSASYSAPLSDIPVQLQQYHESKCHCSIMMFMRSYFQRSMAFQCPNTDSYANGKHPTYMTASFPE